MRRKSTWLIASALLIVIGVSCFLTGRDYSVEVTAGPDPMPMVSESLPPVGFAGYYIAAMGVVLLAATAVVWIVSSISARKPVSN